MTQSALHRTLIHPFTNHCVNEPQLPLFCKILSAVETQLMSFYSTCLLASAEPLGHGLLKYPGVSDARDMGCCEITTHMTEARHLALHLAKI